MQDSSHDSCIYLEIASFKYLERLYSREGQSPSSVVALLYAYSSPIHGVERAGCGLRA